MSDFSWPNGCKGAVSLTYDDALKSHHADVAPLLERHGLRGTFNVNIVNVMSTMMDEPEGWREIAARGHELGNHSIFHPCRKEKPGQAKWLNDAFNLCDYNEVRWKREMQVASFVLKLIDGRDERTYGNTCCNTTLGRGQDETSLDPIIEELFVAGRGPCNSQVIDPAGANLNALGHYSGDRKSFEQLKGEVEAAVASGGWIVYMIHGVGAETHNLYIEPEEHGQFVEWLGAEKSRIWTATMIDVARHLRAARQ